MKTYTLKEKPEYKSKLKTFLNKSLEYDFITNHMLKRCIFQDPNQNPNQIYLTIENKKLIAILITTERIKEPKELIEKQKHILWIKTIAIHPKYRTKQLFKKQLEITINQAKQRNKNEIRIANFASWYFHPGIDIKYEYYLQNYIQNNFTKYNEVIDYHIDLKNFKIPKRIKILYKKLIENNYRFKQIKNIEKTKTKEITKIINFIKQNFSPNWATEAKMALKEPNGGLWIAYNNQNQIIGFSAYSALEPNWFGPIGVIEKERRKGIGTILLYKALNSIRLNGIRYATIPWTNHLKFYTQLSNIIEIRHYWQLKQSIT